MQISWIAGHITAGNATWGAMMLKQGIQSDLLRGTDYAALEAWVANHCSANPLATLNSAAIELEKALLDRVSPSATGTNR
jgi:hypothetical protein